MTPKTNAEVAKELVMLAADESTKLAGDDRTTLHDAAARLVKLDVDSGPESRLKRRLTIQAQRIIRVVVDKDRAYGSSWKQAPYAPFENIRRKFDRLRVQVSQVPNWDLLKMLREERDSEDTLADLVGYGLLALQEVHAPHERPIYVATQRDPIGELTPLPVGDDDPDNV